MANKLIAYTSEAFNGGNVIPTVFLFPPRKVNSRGPMIWNHQLLEFAGYPSDDGSILGDPMSVALTSEIMELGWEPPTPRGRWDLLPLVVMADDDVPVMVEIPPPLSRLVQIRHPRYSEQFDKLDLRWVAAPALTRFGFDIGGVQYTAAPFIGWFMDAEIGVRDLADSFRYNVLPDVAKAIGLLDGKTKDGVEGLEDLPEYERLLMLTRAQTELTYAVYWSYQQAKVSMSDTLTASMKWCRYDDDFKAKNGFRLPADPYWLAPPQGSIVPVWHRGGAPNYQPKPMICKHVQDPLRAWRRERPDNFVPVKALNSVAVMQARRPPFQARSTTNECGSISSDERHIQVITDLVHHAQSQEPVDALSRRAPSDTLRTQSRRLFVSVYFCSAGTFAEKVATKLHARLIDLAKSVPTISQGSTVKPLNELQVSALDTRQIILAVVSSTGQGEVPANGSHFIKKCDEQSEKQLKPSNSSFRFAIFGNGDSRYSATYNGAATAVERRLRQIGGLPLAGAFYQGDSARQSTALQALSPWWSRLQPSIRDVAAKSPKLKRVHSQDANEKKSTLEFTSGQVEASLQVKLRCKELRDEFQEASVVAVTPTLCSDYQGTYQVTLDIRGRSYHDLDCVQLLPSNSPAKVRRALRALGVNASDRITLGLPDIDSPSYSKLFAEHIDLESPFDNFEWLQVLSFATINKD
ncbi:MAG: hypothetical protein Q9170_006008, partial [Blastenia crenularia]